MRSCSCAIAACRTTSRVPKVSATVSNTNDNSSFVRSCRFPFHTRASQDTAWPDERRIRSNITFKVPLKLRAACVLQNGQLVLLCPVLNYTPVGITSKTPLAATVFRNGNVIITWY